MKSKTRFPEKEPKMSIGLVLPEDKQLDLEIKINGNEFDIQIDQEKIKTAQHELSVQHTSNGILVNDIECKELEIIKLAKQSKLLTVFFSDKYPCLKSFHNQIILSI